MLMYIFTFLFGVVLGVAFCGIIRDAMESVAGFFMYVKDSYSASKATEVTP